MDQEGEEQLILQRARRALSPSADDQQRVLLAVLPAIAAPPSVVEQEPALERVASGLTAARRASQYLVGVLALGMAGAAGYGWGYRAGHSAPQASTVAPPAVAALASSAPAAAPQRKVEVTGATDLVVSPGSVGSLVKSPPPAPSPSASVAALALGLDEEVRQLRRIERAVREGNPRLALVLAEDLDRALPRGQMLVERRAAVMMAECQLGSDGAVTSAATFVAKNPGSPYTARLRHLCNLAPGEQRNPMPSGTDANEKGGLP